MFQVRDPLVQRRGDLPVAALYLCELPSQVAGRRTDLLAVVPLQGSVVPAARDRPQGRDLVRDLLLHPCQVRGLTADRLRISRYRIGVMAKRRPVGRSCHKPSPYPRERSRLCPVDHNVLPVRQQAVKVNQGTGRPGAGYFGGQVLQGGHAGRTVTEPVRVRAVMLWAELPACGTVTWMLPRVALAWTAYATPRGSRRDMDPMLVMAVAEAGGAEKETSMLPTLVLRVAVADDRPEPRIDPALSRTWTGPDSYLRVMPPALVCALTWPVRAANRMLPTWSLI